MKHYLPKSPCLTCKWYPAGSIFHDNCPQSHSLPYKWVVPIDIWEEITRRTGCVCKCEETPKYVTLLRTDDWEDENI